MKTGTTAFFLICSSFIASCLTSRTHPLLRDVLLSEKPKRSKDIVSISRIGSTQNQEKFCSVEWAQGIVSHDQAMYLVANHMGLTENCRPYPNAEKQFSDLEKGDLTVGAAPGYQSILADRNLSFLYPHDIENLCLLVHKAPAIQQSMLLTVYYTIWVTIGGCLLFFVTVAVIGYRNTVDSALFQIIQTFLTGAFAGRLRLVMVWLSILSFFMGNTIAGSFTGFIVTPGREKEMDTLEAVAAQIKTVYASDYHLHNVAVLVKGDDAAAAVAHRVNFTDLFSIKRMIPPATAMMGNPKIMLMATQQAGADDGEGVSNYHQVKQCMIETGYLSYAVRKGWRGAARFDALMQRLVEGGVIAKLRHRHWSWFLRHFNRVHGTRSQPSSTHGTGHAAQAPARPLGLTHVREAFALWAAATGAATVAFAAEQYGRLRRRRQTLHTERRAF